MDIGMNRDKRNAPNERLKTGINEGRQDWGIDERTHRRMYEQVVGGKQNNQ